MAKFDSEALAPVLEYLRSDALKQGATPEEVKGSTSMWTPAIQRLKAPIVAGGQQIGSFDLVMGDSPTAIAYSFNGPGNERVAAEARCEYRTGSGGTRGDLGITFTGSRQAP